MCGPRDAAIGPAQVGALGVTPEARTETLDTTHAEGAAESRIRPGRMPVGTRQDEEEEEEEEAPR